MTQIDVQQVKAGFSGQFEGQPEGVWTAPGRVNLIGEHTDYNGGFVMPFALPHASYVAAARREDGVLRVFSRNNGETVEAAVASLTPGSVTGWGAYVMGMAWALNQAGYQVGGADLLVQTNVPTGAGLSSSAALECSVGLALVDLYGHQVEPLELAKIAQRAENDYVGMPCGLMDQMISMLGREGHVVQFDNRSFEATIVPFNAPGAEILVVNTNAPHQLVDGEYAARREQCEEAAEILGVELLRELNDPGAPALDEVLGRLDQEVHRKRVRHQVTENQRVQDTVTALSDGDLDRAGQLMSASHDSLRDDYEVTVEQTDVAQETMLAGGAYGARITGGGFGGCVIALVRTEDTARLTAEVEQAFAQAGFTAPDSFVAVPSAGARRME